jgi:hypothetical protein
MKKIPITTYKTPDEIDAVIKEREAQAALLPPGGARQSVLAEVMRLRSYAEMKRLFA